MLKVVMQLNRLLETKQKIYFVISFILVFIGSFMEMIGISLIIPFVSAIVAPKELLNMDYVQFLTEIFSFKIGRAHV